MATVLQKSGDARQAYIIDKIKELKIRFPVAELASKGIASKGNISEILKGKRGVSDEVFARFCEVYQLDGNYTPVPAESDEAYQLAAIKSISQSLAKVMAKLSGRPVNDCLEEIEQNTSLILNDLRKLNKNSQDK